MLRKFMRELRTLPLYVYFLAILAAFGLSVGAYRLYAGLDAATNLSKIYPWGIWISFDLTTVALSGGAFTLAALVYIFHMHDLHPATRPTVLFGFLELTVLRRDDSQTVVCFGVVRILLQDGLVQLFGAAGMVVPLAQPREAHLRLEGRILAREVLAVREERRGNLGTSGQQNGHTDQTK